jgi:hypothetical protein
MEELTDREEAIRVYRSLVGSGNTPYQNAFYRKQLNKINKTLIKNN